MLTILDQYVCTFIIKWSPRSSPPFPHTASEVSRLLAAWSLDLTPETTCVLCVALTTNRRYEFYVETFAYGAGAQGQEWPKSSIVSAHTSAGTPAGPPRRVRCEVRTMDTLTLTWRPPKQPNGAIMGYRLVRVRLIVKPGSVESANLSPFVRVCQLTQSDRCVGVS